MFFPFFSGGGVEVKRTGGIEKTILFIVSVRWFIYTVTSVKYHS